VICKSSLSIGGINCSTIKSLAENQANSIYTICTMISNNSG
jgi:hypothetical protein